MNDVVKKLKDLAKSWRLENELPSLKEVSNSFLAETYAGELEDLADELSPGSGQFLAAKLLEPAVQHDELDEDPSPMLLDVALFDELRDELPGLMHRWSPHSSRADYECAFCNQRPRTNNADIEHRSDCLGTRLVKALERL